MAILDWLHKSATPLRLLVIAIVTTVMRYGVMPRFGAEAMASPGSGPLDLMFAYSPGEAFAKIAAFTDAGRDTYSLFLYTADLVYPISYTLLFIWAIVLIKRKTRLANSHWPLVAPLLLFGFDLLENGSIIALLSLYPAQPTALALVASLFTTLKWIFVGVTVLVIVWLAFRARTRA